MNIYTYLRLSLTRRGREVRREIISMDRELKADKARQELLEAKYEKYHRLLGTGVNLKLNKEIR